MKTNVLWTVLILSLLASACAPTPAAGPTPAASPTAGTAPEPAASPTLPPPGPVLVLLTHDSWLASDDVLAEFEQTYHVKIDQRPLGDAGKALSQVILDMQSARPGALGDVFYGVDNTLLSRALDANIYQPYKPAGAESIPPQFVLDDQWRVTPIDYGDVCLNYDKDYFTKQNLPLPASLDDLTKPEYKDLLVVENPNASSPGLAFLLATIAHFGPDKYLDYWRALKDNGVKVVEDWNTAYYVDFSGSSGRGPRPLVVSYASSPPAEVIYAPTPAAPGTPPVTEPPTGSITAPGTCFRQVEFAGVLQGASNPVVARQFIDFLLSKRFQEDMPLNMFVFPVNPDAQLPDVFQRFAKLADQPATLTPAEIGAGRDKWLQAWTELMLK
jgi:thiamine transport system substrate-binding protein